MVLQGLSLSIKPFECVAIVGPLGNGTSTLLHLMTGIDRPTRGEVRIDGARLHTLLRATTVALARHASGHCMPVLPIIAIAQLEAKRHAANGFSRAHPLTRTQGTGLSFARRRRPGRCRPAKSC